MKDANSKGLWPLCHGFAMLVALVLAPVQAVWAGSVDISRAEYQLDRERLLIRGSGEDRSEVILYDDDSNTEIARVDADSDGRWRYVENDPASIPCRVRAESDGEDDSRDVRNTEDFPDGCGTGGGGPGPGPGPEFPTQTDFKIMMNYELGMHCTGFEFAYCCVLPVYNSILAQVVKPEGASPFPVLLEGDPAAETRDPLHRETVLRDPELDENGDFKKYVLRYWHEAQPRHNAADNFRGAPQGQNRMISAAEGNSLLSWNTLAYPAQIAGADDPDGFAEGAMKTGEYEGAHGVVLPDKANPSNYQNVVWNHLYIHSDLEGSGGNTGGNVPETTKVRLGLDLVYPDDCGPAFHPLGPVTGDPDAPVDNNCGGFSNGNVLTYSGESGTIVYTQMKVLEDLPITLTSPRIWEALGLPLTPFEDTIDFFNNPSAVTEESVRPFVAMKAQLYDYHTGNAVTDSHGDPVIGFGTAPIDIPNCERCHSNAPGTPNSPNSAGEQWNLVQQEASYWAGQLGGSADEWYPRLKSAAVSMLYAHDVEHGTGFMDCYPFPDNVGAPGCDDLGQDTTSAFLQTTRLGKESVICQKCHADNVIAVVKSAYADAELTQLIPSVTDAIHHNHRSDSELVLTGVACDTNADCDTAAGEVCGTAANNLGICGIPGPIAFSDSHGRDGGCQGCHPAHRSDGDLEGYPITLQGTNFYADGDNRLANGGCFVGRDVHSNPMKDLDAGTPSHLNAVGQWLVDNVTNDQGDWRGIWCTNCHSQLSQEMWKAENCADLVHGDCISNPRAEPTLAAVAAAVGTTPEQAASWLDPKSTDPNGDFTHAIWEPDPGLCAHAASLLDLADPLPAMDANVATIEINLISAANCTTPDALDGPDCFGTGSPAFYICGTKDEDGDFNVALKAAGGNSPFCTTPDCVAAAQGTLDGGFHYDGDPSPDTLVAEGQGQLAIPAPFSAATDGRDHWLAAGEPHCADCHKAPYVEQSGNLNAFAPFNYPRKASLMRYSRGHQDITCQGCHESIHGLYPVTPTIDTTSYAQAASLNHDGSHGPLKCGTCHEVGSDGLPTRIDDLQYNGQRIKSIDDPDERFDAVVSWAHTFTMEHDPTRDYCVNCHGDESREVSWREEEWLEHSMEGRVPRKIMDRVEIQEQGFISGDPEAGQDPLRTVCQGCHGDERDEISCNGEDGREWKEHLTEGRVAEKVWVSVSESSRRTGNTTCGW